MLKIGEFMEYNIFKNSYISDILFIILIKIYELFEDKKPNKLLIWYDSCCNSGFKPYKI